MADKRNKEEPRRVECNLAIAAVLGSRDPEVFGERVCGG